MSITNLEELRKSSKKMKNLIDASGILRNKIRNAKARIARGTAARLAGPNWNYQAWQYRRNATPAANLGLTPTLGAGAVYQTHPMIGQHIKRYAKGHRFGLLHPLIKAHYNAWALEHNQGRPYVYSTPNKKRVARALLQGFRRRKARRARG